MRFNYCLCSPKTKTVSQFTLSKPFSNGFQTVPILSVKVFCMHKPPKSPQIPIFAPSLRDDLLDSLQYGIGIAKPRSSIANGATERENMKRLVLVMVVDPHPDIPCCDSTVYASEEPFLTTLSDFDLVVAIDLKLHVDNHNRAVREKAGLKKAAPSELKRKVIELAKF